MDRQPRVLLRVRRFDLAAEGKSIARLGRRLNSRRVSSVTTPSRTAWRTTRKCWKPIVVIASGGLLAPKLRATISVSSNADVHLAMPAALSMGRKTGSRGPVDGRQRFRDGAAMLRSDRQESIDGLRGHGGADLRRPPRDDANRLERHAVLLEDGFENSVVHSRLADHPDRLSRKIGHALYLSGRSDEHHDVAMEDRNRARGTRDREVAADDGEVGRARQGRGRRGCRGSQGPARPADPTPTAGNGPGRAGRYLGDGVVNSTADSRPSSFEARPPPNVCAAAWQAAESVRTTARVGRGARRSQCSVSEAASSVVEWPSSGSRTSTIVPAPGVERIRIVPPCSSQRDLAMARPRPEP